MLTTPELRCDGGSTFTAVSDEIAWRLRLPANLTQRRSQLRCPSSMKFRVLPAVLAILSVAFVVEPINGAVVFRPGAKAKYVPPGEEELNGNAAELFEIAQNAEKDKNPKRAIRAYKELVRKYPHDAL